MTKPLLAYIVGVYCKDSAQNLFFIPMTTLEDSLTVEIISKRLSSQNKNSEPTTIERGIAKTGNKIDPVAKLAAVLIPFLKWENKWHLLYTRRTTNLVEHSGQVAFPGGSIESGDLSPVMTALREANEEIGLEPKDVTVLGNLNEILTITNYLVTPIVGIIPWPYSFVIEKAEVSRVFTIPLTWLSDPSHYRIEEYEIPFTSSKISTIYFQPYDNEILWGVSAKITLNLINTLFSNKKSRAR
jgi:8-oxo-dGTP pyrophosphatase MutT (NUDIX family)